MALERAQRMTAAIEKIKMKIGAVVSMKATSLSNVRRRSAGKVGCKTGIVLYWCWWGF